MVGTGNVIYQSGILIPAKLKPFYSLQNFVLAAGISVETLITKPFPKGTKKNSPTAKRPDCSNYLLIHQINQKIL